jgi:hypothetical protein
MHAEELFVQNGTERKGVEDVLKVRTEWNATAKITTINKLQCLMKFSLPQINKEER